MAWTKLIPHYLGIPYYSNIHKIKNDNIALVGKGSYQEIKEAKKQFPKRRIGIDCSGLVCQILSLPCNPRKTNADMLTSPPLAKQIPLENIQSGDLIRQKNGHHVVLIVSRENDQISYIHSSRDTKGVVLGKTSFIDKTFFKEGVWRLTFPQATL